MTQDTLAITFHEFGTALIWAMGAILIFALAWLVLRKMADVIIRRAVKRRRMAEPETHGDQGGIPVVKGRVEVIPR